MVDRIYETSYRRSEEETEELVADWEILLRVLLILHICIPEILGEEE